ncbi:MAG: NAD(P)H-dependent oxidoreductase subunit E [Anaerolineales bacterium]|nr:NAD(P)H-dependent oxidoreductase subunit E [Anaerolineales bacterium]
MSDLDLGRLQSLLSESAPLGRQALLPTLQAVQNLIGYLPEAAAAEIGRALGVPLAEVYGVIDFYSLLRREPAGKTVIRVCTDPACELAGSDTTLQAFRDYLSITQGEVSPDGGFSVEEAPCLGLCDHAPAVLLGERPCAGVTADQVAPICRGQVQQPDTRVDGDLRLLTANCGTGQATSLQVYRAGGGYAGLERALRLTPTEVIAEVKDSGLVGRGGAAFPTGLKWEGAANAPGGPKYVVCNADESEPGTFKDRVLMEGDPHRLLEGMLIAAYAIGAQKGYIYIRGEYLQAVWTLERALAEARETRLLDEGVLGAGFSFDVELRLGAGAYICGEETALFESIEGRRGFPRVKPPFPTTHGLFGQPTVINNVETLCNVPLILERGAAWYRELGTGKSTGPKLFCVSGDVAHPGLYEAPFGITLRHLLYDLAGGMREKEELGAVLIGGAAGAFATPEALEVRLSFEDLRDAGLPLGSGVVMAFNASRDMADVLRRLGRFFAHESCGKCYPCQMGTQRQYEILQRLAGRRLLPGDAERLEDVGWTMSDASLCGLGQTAASAVLSAMRLWPELFAAQGTPRESSTGTERAWQTQSP